MTETFDPIPTLESILVEHGPLYKDDIALRLRDAGVPDPDALLHESLHERWCPVSKLVDDRWAWLPSLLAGRVFTHRLSADEVAHDLLVVIPDLDPITTLCEYEPYKQLADGAAAHVAVADYDDEMLKQRGAPAELIDSSPALLLKPGTLKALGAGQGDLVGVRLTAKGLAVARVRTVAQSAAGAQLAATLDGDDPEPVSAAVWTVCAADPAVFTEPLAPLCEIVAEQGLTCHEDWFAPAGFDFKRWDLERDCTRLAMRHDLGPDDAFALHMLVKMYDYVALLLVVTADADEPVEDPRAAVRASAAGPELDRAAEVAGQLGPAIVDPLVAEALVDETGGNSRAGSDALLAFAELMEPRVPRAARVAFRWLRALALERIGDIDATERELLAAESMDPDWPLALLDLARIASDRGDAERGLALLRRAGAEPDHPLLELLERYRTEPRPGLGRNELCWCGSGRKYKKCHLGHEGLPLAERVGWLYAKAAQHALMSDWNDLLIEVACVRGRYNDDDDLDALADPLVLDAVLFEGGAFADFLVVRGSLLPADERLLAEQWLMVERSVFEVEQVQPGHGVSVRDVRTGDIHEVRERAASRQVKSGQLICARVLPAANTKQFFGGIEPVTLHERAPLIDLLDDGPDAVQLVVHLSRRFAPPALANTEGDPLAICEATMQISDPAGIEAALDDSYDRVGGDDAAQWLEHVFTQGIQRIRATLMLDGNMLRAETNSEKRMDDVLATLARLDPTMKVLDDSRRPLRDAHEAAGLAEQMAIGGEDDPEIAVVLEEFIHDYETKWLDEPIPALDGCTPRQAADDPTRRGDLIKLLDSFPTGETALGSMDAGRLRAALGLR